MEVLVFGGTVEGRELVEWLDARGRCDVVASTLTSYGASLLPGGSHVHTMCGPLSDEQKRRLMAEHDFCCVVDATHPYASHISESVARLSRAYDVPLLRIVREQPSDGSWLSFPDTAAAAHHLAGVTGNILLTTGTKDLSTFVEALDGALERLYVRVLPVSASLVRTEELGVPTRQVIAMQGPFSTQLNAALLREFSIRHLVTKQSGTAGGFDEKAQAAQECGISLVVIERPCEERGLSLEEVQRQLEECYGC